jgi:hypothetical protein
MVDAAGSMKPVSVGAGVDQCEGGGEGEPAKASLSDIVATKGGDSGGAGGMGSSEEGEAGMNSSGAGEHEGDDSIKGPGGQGVEGCEEGVDSEEGSSEAVQSSGERRSSFVSSSLLSSSASFCHFLVFFAGGDVTSGDAEAGAVSEAMVLEMACRLSL